jgi:NDP-sugar pyrophosphorylase family protein
MKALIFAAGLGTRLRPLTDHTPKALIKVGGKPLLQHCIQRLVAAGYTDIIINIHYLGQQIVDFLTDNDNFGINITVSDETQQLLDTGGALKKAACFFDANDDFLVHNADVFSEINLDALRQMHISQKNAATLAVSPRPSTRQLIFDAQTHQLQGRQIASDHPHVALAFGGVQMINGAALAQLPADKSVFSIIDFYLSLAQTHAVRYYNHQNEYWVDVGKPEEIVRVENYLNQKIVG